METWWELLVSWATTAMPNLVLVATEMETIRPTGAVPSLEERRDTICQTILSGVENVPSTEGLTATHKIFQDLSYTQRWEGLNHLQKWLKQVEKPPVFSYAFYWQLSD